MKQFQIKNMLKGTLVAALCLSSLSAWAEDYNLWVGGVQVTSYNAGGITGANITGTVTFDPNTNTLTLAGAYITLAESSPAIVSGLDNLIIKLQGRNDIGFAYSYNEQYLVSSTNASAILEFVGMDEEEQEGCLWTTYGSSSFTSSPFNGFGGITYDGDLAYFPGTDCQYVGKLKSPSVSLERNSLYLSSGNDYSGENTLSFYYTIDYADETEDITTATLYDEQVTQSITHPCTITAYTHYNYGGIQKNSGNVIAKYFAFEQSEIRGVIGTEVDLPAFVPSIAETDDVEISFEGNMNNDQTKVDLTSASLGNTIVYAYFTKGDNTPYTVLGGSAELIVNIVPPVPTVSVSEGTYPNSQYVELTSNLPSGLTGYIHYRKEIDGVLQTDSTYDSTAITIAETMTLHVYQEAFNGEGNPFYSDTLAIDYVILQTPGLAFIDEEQVESAVATIGETFTQPTLENENEVAVTYSSSNTNVATVATNGTVTLVGVGQTIIKAKSEQTDVWLADSAQYTLTVYKPLSHATVTINVAEATYPTLAPEVTVTDGESTILPKYYQVSYSNNTGAASAEDSPAPTVTITATELQAEINYYTGSATKTYTIAAQSITDFDISLSAESFEYNGAAQEPEVSFMEAGKAKEMTENVDYTLTYANNQNAGSAESGTAPQVTIAGKGNYTGSVVKKFSITAKSLEGATINLSEDSFIYSGDSIKPAVTVTFVDAPVEISETDYTVSYTNNLNAATTDDSNPPTIIVTGKGNFTGATSVSFDIDKADLAGVTIAAIEAQTFTGDSIKPGVTVMFNGKAVAATEYDITYTNNVNVSAETSATVTLTAKGVNFTEGSTKTASFQIVAATATITAVASQETTYNGEPQAVTATVDKGTVVITYFTSETNRTSNTEGTTDAPTNAGTYYVKVTQGNANYTSTAVDVTFTINPKALTDDMVTLSAESFPYNGETQKPTVTVSDGTAMTADDYTVANNGGQAVGTYDVVVTGQGNYTGEVTKSFSIVNRTLEVGANADVQFAAGQTWASFYTTTESLELPEGVMAYIVTAVSETSATLQAISYVPQNVPVFLENNSTETTENTSADGNLLQGTTAATAVSTISGTVYGLHNNKLMQVTSGSIPAGRAYLTVDAPAGGRELTMIKESDTTGIETFGVDDVDSKDLWYDMTGRKLQSKPNKKGFYIKNGKKVFVNK